jgi:hypothetical protein
MVAARSVQAFTMAYDGDLFMRDDPQVLSRRLAAFVRPFPAKALALRIGCTERTAENIRRGHWPIARHFLSLVREFGRDLTECVFHPDAAAARLEEEVAALEAELADKRAALGLVAKETASFRPRVAPVSGRRAAAD